MPKKKHRCNEPLGTFRSMFDRFSIEYTNYIRTTDANHARAVQHVWQELVKQNLIYKGSYEGWYSVQDECFVSEDEVRIRSVRCRLRQLFDKRVCFSLLSPRNQPRRSKKISRVKRRSKNRAGSWNGPKRRTTCSNYPNSASVSNDGFTINSHSIRSSSTN